MSQNDQIALLREAYIAELYAPVSLRQMYRTWKLSRMLDNAIKNLNK